MSYTSDKCIRNMVGIMIGRLIRFIVLSATAGAVFLGLWLVETDQLADFLDSPTTFFGSAAQAPLEAAVEAVETSPADDRQAASDVDEESEIVEQEVVVAEEFEELDGGFEMSDEGEAFEVEAKDVFSEEEVAVAEETEIAEAAPAPPIARSEAPVAEASAPLQPPPPAIPTVGVETQVISPPVNIIEGPQPGQVAYKPPDVMLQGETYEIVIRIGDNETSDIAEGIPGSGSATVEQLTIFPVMSVRLDGGDDFEVRGLSREVQWMAAGTPTQWLFEVTPLEAGDAKKLRLFFAWELPTGDASVGRDLEPFVREIEVTVNRAYQAQRFVIANLEWGFAGAGAFFGFLFRRVFQRRRA